MAATLGHAFFSSRWFFVPMMRFRTQSIMTVCLLAENGRNRQGTQAENQARTAGPEFEAQ